MTVQPTEQCVQTFLRVASVAPGGGGGPALALRTAPSGRVPRAARPPAARPERRRKLRRSTPALAWTARSAAIVERRASRWGLLISTSASFPSPGSRCRDRRFAPPASLAGIAPCASWRRPRSPAQPPQPPPAVLRSRPPRLLRPPAREEGLVDRCPD